MIKHSLLYFVISGLWHLVILSILFASSWFIQPRRDIIPPIFFVQSDHITVDFEPERINSAECFSSEPLKVETSEITILSDNDAEKPRLLSSESSSEEKPLLSTSNKPPSYPRLARLLGQEGLVVLLVEITDDGIVSDIKLIKSTGYKLLDESAIKSVKGWRFIPATKNGKTLASRTEIPIRFKLTS
ncbi:MAG: energy transducer TonB [Planctomycetota bacterium]|nr:energy transducer TonB [Planctomycetota bacterium]MDI6786748.1 energy transducer TonB [Planctomycetota bacterium]